MGPPPRSACPPSLLTRRVAQAGCRRREQLDEKLKELDVTAPPAAGPSALPAPPAPPRPPPRDPLARLLQRADGGRAGRVGAGAEAVLCDAHDRGPKAPLLAPLPLPRPPPAPCSSPRRPAQGPGGASARPPAPRPPPDGAGRAVGPAHGAADARGRGDTRGAPRAARAPRPARGRRRRRGGRCDRRKVPRRPRLQGPRPALNGSSALPSIAPTPLPRALNGSKAPRPRARPAAAAAGSDATGAGVAWRLNPKGRCRASRSGARAAGGWASSAGLAGRAFWRAPPSLWGRARSLPHQDPPYLNGSSALALFPLPSHAPPAPGVPPRVAGVAGRGCRPGDAGPHRRRPRRLPRRGAPRAPRPAPRAPRPAPRAPRPAPRAPRPAPRAPRPARPAPRAPRGPARPARHVRGG